MSPNVNRRNLVLAGAGLALAPRTVGQKAYAASGTNLGNATQFRERVQAFVSILSPDQAEAARFPLGGDVQARWNFMGAGGFVKPGLRLEQMDKDQKTAAWDILASVLSPRGLEKARDVMNLQQVLIDMGNSASARSPERYSFAIFGEPAANETWALRLEGHHLSLTFTVANDQLTGVTPSSFSVNPNRVKDGAHAGLVTLKREDDLARKLAADFAGKVKERAFFKPEPYRNVRALAGREMPFEKREGIALADLSQTQRDLLAELIDAYASEHLTAIFARGMAAHLAAGDEAATHFAFSGATEVGQPAYYRIHGDRHLIEFAAVDATAQHLHTVFHLA